MGLKAGSTGDGRSSSSRRDGWPPIRPSRAGRAQARSCRYIRPVRACGLPRPPRLSRAELAQQVSPMTLSFMSESRRIGNARIKNELRARLLYPTVADALRAR